MRTPHSSVRSTPPGRAPRRLPTTAAALALGVLALGGCGASLGGSVYDALVDGRPLAGLHVATPVERLRIVPSSISLAGVEIELAREAGRERRLGRAITSERDAWDWVLVDCPPSLGLLTINAFVAASEARENWREAGEVDSDGG